MSSFAFVFPGQGSQAVGMLDAWGDHAAVRKTLDEASQALGEDVAALIRGGPKEALDSTVNTQPAMLAAGVACYRAWLAEGGAVPMAVAGHSLGEYTALVAAGVLSLSDAMPLVRLRATAMQDAVPAGVGTMAAILGLEATAVIDGCAQVAATTGQVVSAANFNDPRQTVIAGHVDAVVRACDVMKGLGAKRAVMLPVSAPFHCALMRPAAERLKSALAEVPLGAPRMPWVNNVDVAVVGVREAIIDALYRQAFSPVRWVEVVQALRARGARHVIECGPGKVLSGLNRRIDAELVAATVHDPDSMAQTAELLRQ